MNDQSGWEFVLPDGLEVYVSRPARSNGHAIVLLQEILGVNRTMRETAQEMSGEGYTVVVPDLYWRMQRHVDLDYGKEDVQTAFSFSKRIDDKLALEDIEAATRHALATGTSVRCVHLMGFCLGGRLAVLGAQLPTVASAISLYGVGIERHLDVLARVVCPLQLHFGESDRWVPVATVDAIEHAVSDENVEIHRYPGTDHGFFPRSRPGYQREASQLAWRRIREFMEKAISAPA